MKRLLAAAAIAATFVGVTAASANPMGGYGYGHGQSYGSSNWGAGGYAQQREGRGWDRDRGYERRFDRWEERRDDRSSNYGYGPQGYVGYGAGFAFPSQHGHGQHW
jgi:hypothetical protein